MKDKNYCPIRIFLDRCGDHSMYYMPETNSVMVEDLDGNISSGMDLAESGKDIYLAKALAKAKDRGLYKTKKESILVPEYKRPLFVVVGTSGYPFHPQLRWIVGAFRVRSQADAYAKACQEAAELWLSNHNDCDPPFSWSLLDPRMTIIDQSISYKVEETFVAMRSEELSSYHEMCPVCRGQVYDTSEGRICENGHSL